MARSQGHPAAGSVKVFYEIKTLQETLTALGFATMIYQLNDIFFFLEARRS
jgi:hypothetical protein